MALHIQRKRMSAMRAFCCGMIVLLSALNLLMMLVAIAGGHNAWEASSDDDKWRSLISYFAWIAAYCWLETREPDQ